MMVGYQTLLLHFHGPKQCSIELEQLSSDHRKIFGIAFGLLCSAISPETHATISTNQTQN